MFTYVVPTLMCILVKGRREVAEGQMQADRVTESLARTGQFSYLHDLLYTFSTIWLDL